MYMICISYTSQIHNMATEAPPFFFSPCLSLSLSLSLSLYIRLVCSWHQRIASLLCPKTLFVPGHLPLLILPPLMSGSVMIKLVRTFLRTFFDMALFRLPSRPF